jgi:hypothetical protein
MMAADPVLFGIIKNVPGVRQYLSASFLFLASLYNSAPGELDLDYVHSSSLFLSLKRVWDRWRDGHNI